MASKAKRIRVSLNATSTVPSTSSSSLSTSCTVLRGTMMPAMPTAPSGSGISTRANRWPSGRHRAHDVRAVGILGVQVDAVQVVPRLFGGDGEPGLFDQALQLVRRDLKSMRQLAVGHRREVLAGEAREREGGAARSEVEATVFAAEIEAHLAAVGQLADDVVERMCRHGGAAGFGDLGRGDLDDGEVQIGGRQLQLAVFGDQLHVGENRDRVALFDHALNVRERAEEGAAFDGQFHRFPVIFGAFEDDNAAPDGHCAAAPGSGHPNSRIRCRSIAELHLLQEGFRRFDATHRQTSSDAIAGRTPPVGIWVRQRHLGRSPSCL